MLGIEHYAPKFLSDKEELIKVHGDTLKSLIGQPILKSWVMWDLIEDEWWAECPVILQIGDRKVELCAWKLDEFSITWDSIDIRTKPNWYDVDEIRIDWKENAMQELNSCIGKTVQAVEIIEYIFESTVVDSLNTDELGQTNSGWVLNGLGLVLDDGYVCIYNALDQNGITNKPLTTSLIGGCFFSRTSRRHDIT